MPSGRRTKSTRAARLGPFGPGVEIRFVGHAMQRFRERIQRADKTFGLSDLEALIRNPNTKAKDVFSEDPQHPDRVLRWVRLPGPRLLTFKVVFDVDRPRTPTDPGAIAVVSVVPEDNPI